MCSSCAVTPNHGTSPGYSEDDSEDAHESESEGCLGHHKPTSSPGWCFPNLAIGDGDKEVE